MIVYSLNYGDFKPHYHDGWDKIPAIFQGEFERLMACQPDCILMACNTLHKAYDIVAPKLKLPIPFFHAVHLTRDHLAAQGLKKILFLGTRFTMEDDYFMAPLRAAGIELVLPNADDRMRVGAYQTELAKGVFTPEQTAYFSDLCNRAMQDGCRAVILACTELPLAINKNMTALPIVDPLILQCNSAVDFALS